MKSCTTNAYHNGFNYKDWKHDITMSDYIMYTDTGIPILTYINAVLTHGQAGQLPGGPTSTGVYANLCMLCVACFLMFKLWFCWKYQYNKYMFNFIDIYSFIHASGCVGISPSALLCLGAYNAVKTALTYIILIMEQNSKLPYEQ